MWVLVALGAAFVPAAGLAWIVAGRLLRPVQHLREVVDQVDDPGTAARAGSSGSDELGTLADGLDRMLDRLEEAQREQERRLHEVVHELRTPLAVATTNLELARRSSLTDDAVARIEAGRRALERMGRTVDDLAAHGRLSLGPDGAAPRQLDLAAEATALGGEHDAPARLRGISIRTAGPPTLVVPGDGAGLRTAAGNLLANAIRLAPAGSSVTLAWGERQGWAWLGVGDEGPGIAGADHARVFERYWRGRYDADRDRRKPPRPAGEQPRGIGLTIARQVVEAAGGRITLSSTEGAGSTFVLWLPASPGAQVADVVAADGLHPLADPLVDAGAETRRSRRTTPDTPAPATLPHPSALDAGFTSASVRCPRCLRKLLKRRPPPNGASRPAGAGGTCRPALRWPIRSRHLAPTS